MFNWRKWFKKDKQKTLSDKEIATKAGIPYVNILQMNVDPDNLTQGSIELDFNEFFIAKLIKAGYSGDTNEKIVDQWFSALCNGIATELWEQEYADPEKRKINKINLGNGRYEVR